jgi:hypothetical protein
MRSSAVIDAVSRASAARTPLAFPGRLPSLLPPLMKSSATSRVTVTGR